MKLLQLSERECYNHKREREPADMSESWACIFEIATPGVNANSDVRAQHNPQPFTSPSSPSLVITNDARLVCSPG